MAAARLDLAGDLRIEQGATWVQTVCVETAVDVPRDLTGYAARMQIRSSHGGSVMLEPTCTISGVAGTVSLSLTAAATTALVLTEPAVWWVYDLELVHASGIERLLEGRVQITREVTR